MDVSPQLCLLYPITVAFILMERRNVYMKKFMNWFVSEESGQGLVEYGLIIALIAVVVIGALTALGTKINDKFGAINTALGG